MKRLTNPLLHSSWLSASATLLRFARRDFRSSSSTLFVSSFCVALSVFLVVLVSSTSQGITNGLKSQGRSILGGDVAFINVHRDISGAERDWISSWGAVSTTALTRTMGRTDSGNSTLVEVKAVDGAYPLIGEFKSSTRHNRLQETFSVRNGFGASVEKDLLDRLELKIGDPILLGGHVFWIVSTIETEPDRLSNGIGFGPRAIISIDAAKLSGLVQDGSLTRWITRAALFDSTRLEELLSETRIKFPGATWQVRTRDDSVPALQRNIDRLKSFLIVVCVLVLILGGIGVSNSVRLFVDRRSRDFAILKSLGASNGFVFLLSFGEIAFIALVSACVGALFGASGAYLIAFLVNGLYPIPLEAGFFPKAIFGGISIGVMGAVTFSVPPLARLYNLSTTEILRAKVAYLNPAIPFRYWFLFLVGTSLTALIALYILNDTRMGSLLISGAFGCIVVLSISSDFITRVIRRAPRPKGLIARFAFSNMIMPGALARPVIVTFGLGMAVISFLLVLDINVRSQFSNTISSKSPDIFFIDVPARQATVLKDLIHQHAPGAETDMTPMMRGRLIAINGAAISRQNISENVAWILEGDRGISFSALVPKNSKVIEGEWWGPENTAEALVSIDATIAKGLQVKLGDFISMSVMGREITARVSSLRKLEWSSLGLNFVFVFSPNTFSGAPFMQTAAVHLHTNLVTQQKVIRAISRELPHVVAIPVRETFDKLAKFAEQLGALVLSLTLVLFGLALLVLSSAITANQELRLYPAAVLVALGASRRKVLSAFAFEFLMLGSLAVMIGMTMGTAAAWIMVHRFIDADEIVVPVAVLAGAGLAIIITVSLLGLLLTRRELQGRLGFRLKHSQ
jgi:putative ABC transport system permease protein